MPPEKLRFSTGKEVLIPRVGEDPWDYNHCTWLSLKDVAIGEMISVFNTDQDPLFSATMFNATLQKEFAVRVEGGSVTNLYFEKLKNIDVSYPSLPEQKKIAAFFENIDNLITLHQRKHISTSIYLIMAKKTLIHTAITNEWEQRKLSDYLEVSKIKNKDEAFGKEDVLSVSGDYGIVNQIEFQGRSFAGASVAPYGVVESGDVVYTKSPLKSNPYGIIKTNKGKPGIVSTLYAVYKPLDNVYSEFVQIYFEQDARMNNYMHPLVNKGAKNDMKVSDENALKGEVCFPSKNEQIRISRYFSELDNLITLHQRKYCVAKMAVIKPKKLHILVYSTNEWEQRKLGEQMYIKSRIGWQALTRDEYLETGDYYLITGTDIDENSHTVDLKRCFYVSKERYEMDDKIQVREGDIIVTKDGTIGKVAMVTGLDKPATLNSHLFVLRDLSGNLDNRYLLQMLNSHIFDAFVNSTKTGSTLTGLSQKTFVEFQFPVPNYEEQKLISGFFDNLDNLITLHQCKPSSIQNKGG